MTSLLLWSHHLVHLVTTADPVPDDSEVTPGPWMAVLVLGLILASVLLWISMRKHLRRINLPGDEPTGSSGAPRSDGSLDREVDNDRPADPPFS